MNMRAVAKHSVPVLFSACLGLLVSSASYADYGGGSGKKQLLSCSEAEGVLCTEQFDIPGYGYVGHDEPSLLYYSAVPGSGNSNIWRMKLPMEPPTYPQQNGKGGTWNFQLHPAFWFGMAMCDTQSYPEYTKVCHRDSDGNIYDSADPKDAHYIGKHPGAGFMEMQFYPPGWFPTSYNATEWTAAINIDSLSENGNTGQGNNAACGGAIEYVNFALIQTDGKPAGPPSPLLQNGSTFTANAKTLFMNPGDDLLVEEYDTASGLKIVILDLTTGESGFMVASAKNGFAQILFDPNGTSCDPKTHNLPYDFHPMYATSSEHTRVPWAAHSYNIAFSDEIGHFEYCSAVKAEAGACLDPPADATDEQFCFDAGYSASFGYLPLGGCLDADEDFDGVGYQNKTWPGSLKDVAQDQRLHAAPIQFASPLFVDASGRKRDYARAAFETDQPRIEFFNTPICQRFVSNPADPSPGAGCTNPPKGAAFYPFYSTVQTEKGCRWELGGPYLPNVIDDFGGSSAAEYGALLALTYPGANGMPSVRYNDFRRVLTNNPCPAGHSADNVDLPLN